ncbi:MAG: hypothetical protein QM743_02060 [Chitinophagaceae bacterium]
MSSLLLARTYEALAQCALKEKEPKAAARWTYELMRSYPQLIPFSGLKAPLRLRISGNDAAVITALKNCNFDFEAAGSNTCYADIRFYTQNNRKQIQYRLMDAQGRVIVKEQSFSYKDATQAGKDVARRLCNIGGTASEEKAVRKEVKK